MQTIARTWKMESLHIDGQDSLLLKLDSVGKEMYNSLLQQTIERSKFTYYTNGKFVFDMGNEKIEGIFSITKNGKFLITQQLLDGKTGTADTALIELLKENKMIIKNTDPVTQKVITKILVAKN